MALGHTGHQSILTNHLGTMKKKVVLKTQPCLTPILVSKELLKTFSVFMEYISFWYMSLTIFKNGPLILYLLIL